MREFQRRLRFALVRAGLRVRRAGRRLTRLPARAGAHCPECGGKGVVPNREVEDFIREVGLQAYCAAVMLGHREDVLGDGRELPASAWERLGLSQEAAGVFLEDVRDDWPAWPCDICSGLDFQEVTERALDAVLEVEVALGRRRDDPRPGDRAPTLPRGAKP